jgi:hypothetical protein
VVVGGESGDESGRTLRERWPSARSAGRVGSEAKARECGHTEPNTCPLCATCDHADSERCVLCVDDDEHPTVRTAVSNEVPIPETATAPEAETTAEGFDRPPEWSPEAVVQTASGEETEIGSPGGTAYGEVVVPGAESAVRKSALPYLPPPGVLEGPEPWKGTELFEESDVRLGLVPPPEVVARERAESRPSRLVSAKEWRSDWYAARFGESDGDGEPQLASEVSRSIEELVRVEGVTSIPAVLGRLGIDPSHREEVEEVVAEARSE